MIPRPIWKVLRPGQPPHRLLFPGCVTYRVAVFVSDPANRIHPNYGKGWFVSTRPLAAELTAPVVMRSVQRLRSRYGLLISKPDPARSDLWPFRRPHVWQIHNVRHVVLQPMETIHA